MQKKSNISIQSMIIVYSYSRYNMFSLIGTIYLDKIKYK